VKTARNAFWIIFFLSIALIGFLLLSNNNPPTGTPGDNGSLWDAAYIVWIPLITALISLIGALTTSVMTMRRERFESRKVELEVTKLQLEIERLKREAGDKIGPEPDSESAKNSDQ
jgi:hypothetical protein